ncbi:MAG: class I SAM-dependent methyltransferase [Desulfotalea sp.]
MTNNAPILFEDKSWFIAEKPIETGEEFINSGMVNWLNLHLNKNLVEHVTIGRDVTGIAVYKKESSRCDCAKKLQTITYLFICHEEKNTRRKKLFQDDDYQFTLLENGNKHCLYQVKGAVCASHKIQEIASRNKLEIIDSSNRNGRLYLHCHTLETSFGDFKSDEPDSFRFLLKNSPLLLQEAAISIERRMNWLQLITNAQRIIHRGELSLPVSIDIYDKYLSISGFSESDNSLELKDKLKEVLRYIESKHTWNGALIRQHAQNPHKAKLIHDVISFGDKIPKEIQISENGLSYIVNINDSQHVGLFLDQRDSRKRLQECSAGRRIANLFSFTCSFSLAAIAAKAEVVFSVDLAGSTLARGKENFAINKLDETGKGKFIKDDVCKWLNRQEKKLDNGPDKFAYWDAIVCDPPVFASAGKGRGFHVEKQWNELARQCRKIMSKKGVAIFANNHRSGKNEFYYNLLKKHFRIVEKLAPALDFPSLKNQPEHVRIYWCEI